MPVTARGPESSCTDGRADEKLPALECSPSASQLCWSARRSARSSGSAAFCKRRKVQHSQCLLGVVDIVVFPYSCCTPDTLLL